MPAGADADLAAAQALFRGWDRRTNVESRAAPLAVLTVLRLQQAAGKPPLEVLKTVMGELKSTFGRIDPTWGEVNRIRRGKLDLPIDGGPDIFRAVYGRPDPDGRLRALGGDTYIMFVSWDRDGAVSSRSIHQFGSATLDETSPHFADQTPLFAAMLIAFLGTLVWTGRGVDITVTDENGQPFTLDGDFAESDRLVDGSLAGDGHGQPDNQSEADDSTDDPVDQALALRLLILRRCFC